MIKIGILILMIILWNVNTTEIKYVHNKTISRFEKYFVFEIQPFTETQNYRVYDDNYKGCPSHK